MIRLHLLDGEAATSVAITRPAGGVFGGGSYAPPAGEPGKLVVYNTDRSGQTAAEELVNALLYGGASGIQVTVCWSSDFSE